MPSPARARPKPSHEAPDVRDGLRKPIRMRSAVRREQIVNASIRLIGEYGVRGTTMSRVAEAVGLTPMAIYRHFPDKTALLQESSARLVAKTVDWLRSSSAPSVVERLREIGEAHGPLLSANVRDYSAPMMQFVTLTPGESDLYECGVTGSAPVSRILSGLVDEGRAQGTIRPDVDPSVFAREWVAWAQGEDIGYVIGLRTGTFSREPYLRILHLILSDIATPGVLEVPSAERASCVRAPQEVPPSLV
jgi:AcrR family transcriptional regulator